MERPRELPAAPPAPGRASLAEPRAHAVLQRACRAAPGRWSLVQLLELAESDLAPADVQALAAAGVAGAGHALPHLDAIQRAFGPDHDLSSIRAQVGGDAATASTGIGARAYAIGERVAFAEAPDLHTAAHEATHVIQQRSGISLEGGLGRRGDRYEREADAVAERVVRGESAAALLAGYRAGTGAPLVQRAAAPAVPSAPVRNVADAVDHLVRAMAASQGADPAAATALAVAVQRWLEPLLADANVRARFAPGQRRFVEAIAGELRGSLLVLVLMLRHGAQPRGVWPATIHKLRHFTPLLEVAAGERDARSVPSLVAVERADAWMLRAAGAVSIAVAGAVAAPAIASEAALIAFGARQGAIAALTLMLQHPLATVSLGELGLGVVVNIGMSGGLAAYVRQLGTLQGFVGAVIDIIQLRGAATADWTPPRPPPAPHAEPTAPPRAPPAEPSATAPAANVIARGRVVAVSEDRIAIEVAPAPAPQVTGFARVRGAARQALEQLAIEDQATAAAYRRSLAHAGDDVVEAVNRFWGVTGFDKVFSDYMKGGNFQQGARFVMRWAVAHVPDPKGRALAFEMPAMDGMRRVDIFLDGIRYELKSVAEVRAALVNGGSTGLGQLMKDIAYVGVEDLARLRWVFDGADGLTHAEVVGALRDAINAGFLAGYPLRDRILASLDTLVEVW